MSTPVFEPRIYFPSTYEAYLERLKYLRNIIRTIFVENNIPFEENKELSPTLKVDFYSEQHKMAVDIYDLVGHNSTKEIYVPTIPVDLPYKRWLEASSLGIRLICAYENEMLDSKKYFVLRNMIQYQCGIYKRFMARKTYVEIKSALSMKPFYEKNNIQGYRNAKTVFILKDKETDDPLMMYSVGTAFFGKGVYDAEIARGACDINWQNSGVGIQVVGGASKLWKNIIEYYDSHSLDGGEGHLDTIVYYSDNRYYDARSIGHLMDSGTISGSVRDIGKTLSFMNYWRDIEDNPEDRRGVVKNREPMRHKMITEGYANGNILCIPNAGTTTHLWERKNSA